MQRYFDRVRAEVEELRDLACAKVGPEAQRDELPVAVGEPLDCREQVESQRGVGRFVTAARDVERLETSSSCALRRNESSMQRLAIPTSQAAGGPLRWS